MAQLTDCDVLLHIKNNTHIYRENIRKLSGEVTCTVSENRRVCTSHGRAGVTVKERQWRAAGEEERAGMAAFPYILYTSESLRYSCMKEESEEGNTSHPDRRGHCRISSLSLLYIDLQSSFAAAVAAVR